MAAAISPLTQAGLAEAVADAARQYYCPGLSAAVYVNGETLCATVGVLNLATQEPVTPHALFQIGSVSKLVTAALVMQLVEAGKVGLDQSVSALLGGAPIGKGDFSARVTVRHLLTHMSGQDGDLFEDTGRNDDCIARYAVLCRDLDFLCAPGLHYNYCNAGYCLLGRIVEIQTGLCFEDAAQQFVCSPLGLDRLMGRAENTLAHRVAVGHAPGENGALTLAPLTILPRALVPAGLTLYSTPSDMLTFAAAHFPKASAAMPKRILRHATAAQMRQPQTTLPDRTHWGLGWKLIPARRRTFAGHDGGTVGQSAYLWAEPESETIVAISANGGLSAAAFKQIADPIFRAACGDIPEPQLPAILSDPGDLQVYEGAYENAGVRMVLRAEGDHVHAVAQQKYFGMPDIVFTMRPAGDHKFRVSLGGDDTIVMSFPSFNAAGRPDLFYAGRLHRRTGD